MRRPRLALTANGASDVDPTDATPTGGGHEPGSTTKDEHQPIPHHEPSRPLGRNRRRHRHLPRRRRHRPRQRHLTRRRIHTRPIDPCRILDTRPNHDIGNKTGGFGPNDTHTVHTRDANTGQCDPLPAGITGLALNVTAVGASELTHLTFWASGPVPNSSSLNPAPGQPPTPNAVTADLAGDGSFMVFNFAGNVQLIIDVLGYYTDHHHDDRYYTKNQSNGRYYTQDEVDEKTGVDVVVSDGIFVDTLSFEPEAIFTSLNETITTGRTGVLNVSKYFRGSVLCAPDSFAIRLYFITVDGVALRSSFIRADNDAMVDVRLQGTTESPVPAGDHEIGIGALCVGNNTPSGSNATIISNASVVVLPTG